MGQNRRSILKLFGVAPFGAPQMVKAAMDEKAATLANVVIQGIGADASPTAYYDLKPSDIKKAFLIPGMRAKIEEQIRRQHTRVYYLDPDLAVLRSFSLNAKICFQRQRNIEKSIADLEVKHSWDVIREMVMSVALGGKPNV